MRNHIIKYFNENNFRKNSFGSNIYYYCEKRKLIVTYWRYNNGDESIIIDCSDINFNNDNHRDLLDMKFSNFQSNDKKYYDYRYSNIEEFKQKMKILKVKRFLEHYEKGN